MAKYYGPGLEQGVDIPIEEGQIYRGVPGNMENKVFQLKGGQINILPSELYQGNFQSLPQLNPGTEGLALLTQRGLIKFQNTQDSSSITQMAPRALEDVRITPRADNPNAAVINVGGRTINEGYPAPQGYTSEKSQFGFPVMKEPAMLSSLNAQREVNKNRFALQQAQTAIQEAERTASLAKQQYAADVKAGQPQEYQPGTTNVVRNITGNPALNPLIQDINQAISSGVPPAAQGGLESLKRKESEALTALATASGAEQSRDFGTFNAMMAAFQRSQKEYTDLLTQYHKETQEYRTKLLASMAPGQKEIEIQNQLADLRNEADKFQLETQKRKLSEYSAQTADFAQRRGQEIDFHASFRNQEMALQEKNLLTRLGLLQSARQYEGKTLEAQLGFIKDDFDLQTKIEERLDKQEQNLFDKIDKMTEQSKKTLFDLVKTFEGISIEDMSLDTQNKLKNLARAGGADFSLVTAALTAQKNRYIYDKSKEAGKNTEVVEVNGRKVLIDSATGKTIKDLGIVKTTEEGLTPTSPIQQPYIDSFNSAVIGLPAKQMAAAQSTFKQYLAKNDLEDAKNYIVRVALAGASVDQQNQAIGRKTALDSITVIKQLFSKVPQNLITGTLENLVQKLGASSNPDLAYVGSQIQQQIQVYRRSMTGVAFSPQESAEYAKIFPDFTNLASLNSAKIDSLSDSFSRNNRSVLSFYIGDSNYDKLFGKYETPQLPSQKVSDEQLQKDYKEYLGSQTKTSTQTFDLNNNPQGFFHGFLSVFGL